MEAPVACGFLNLNSTLRQAKPRWYRLNIPTEEHSSPHPKYLHYLHNIQSWGGQTNMALPKTTSYDFISLLLDVLSSPGPLDTREPSTLGCLDLWVCAFMSEEKCILEKLTTGQEYILVRVPLHPSATDVLTAWDVWPDEYLNAWRSERHPHGREEIMRNSSHPWLHVLGWGEQTETRTAPASFATLATPLATSHLEPNIHISLQFVWLGSLAVKYWTSNLHLVTTYIYLFNIVVHTLGNVHPWFTRVDDHSSHQSHSNTLVDNFVFWKCPTCMFLNYQRKPCSPGSTWESNPRLLDNH